MSSVTLRNVREGEQEQMAPPLRDDNTHYPYSMFYSGNTLVGYADTVPELLEMLSPGYESLDEQARLVARIRLAVSVQVASQAAINAAITPEQLAELSEAEREVLNGPRHVQPHGWGDEDELGDVWFSEVPLVLVETGYAPYTDIQAPISGIADVVDPPNITWLRPADEWELIESLHRAEWIRVFEATGI